MGEKNCLWKNGWSLVLMGWVAAERKNHPAQTALVLVQSSEPVSKDRLKFGSCNPPCL